MRGRSWLPWALLALLSGCASTALMMGAREPELASFKPGDTRLKVERKLGRPVWHLGSAEDLIYDVYQFEAERPPEPRWGGVALGFAFFTLGQSELWMRDARSFAPVKQVAVAYDGEGRVAVVSEAWEVQGGVPPPCKRMRRYMTADEAHASLAELARVVPAVDDASAAGIVEMRPTWVGFEIPVEATVNGQPQQGKVIELPPGLHTFEFRAEVSGRYVRTYSMSAVLGVLPGRVYRLKQKRYYAFGGGADDLFWIEDVRSGETVYCSWQRDLPEPDPVSDSPAQR
jgi:hypothetical protein